jgi:hypothetical protein
MADETPNTEAGQDGATPKKEVKSKVKADFKPDGTIEEMAIKYMAESKEKLKLDDNTRERVIKIKVGAMNKIDSDLSAKKDASEQEKAFWKKVKQTISTY